MASLVERNDVNELLKQGLAEQSMIFGRSVIQQQPFYATEQKKKKNFFPTIATSVKSPHLALTNWCACIHTYALAQRPLKYSQFFVCLGKDHFYIWGFFLWQIGDVEKGREREKVNYDNKGV